jgi:hypothetical protein
VGGTLVALYVLFPSGKADIDKIRQCRGGNPDRLHARNGSVALRCH